MSTLSYELPAPKSQRLRLLIWPREHGAWGMLLVPLVTGACAARPAVAALPSLVLFTLAALALFCLRTPLEISLQVSAIRANTPAERRAVLLAMTFYSLLAGLAWILLARTVPLQGLLVLAAIVAPAFVLQAILRMAARTGRSLAEAMGALGLTSTAAGAYYIAAGQLDSRALLLWALNWVFVLNQIGFVQLRIRAARAATGAEKFSHGRSFLAGEALAGILLGAAWLLGGLPGLAGLAFVPVILRGLVWFVERPSPLEIRRLGLTEFGHALIFGVLVILGFYFAGPHV